MSLGVDVDSYNVATMMTASHVTHTKTKLFEFKYGRFYWKPLV